MNKFLNSVRLNAVALLGLGTGGGSVAFQGARMLQAGRERRIMIALGIVGCLASGSAGAALYGFGPAEAWTIEQIASLSESVSANLATFGSTFGSSMADTFEQVISAIAVATKQEALSANVVGQGAQDSAGQLVNAVRAQRESDQVATAYVDYNPSMGQGYHACNVEAENRTLDGAFDGMGATASASVAQLDVAPGKLVASTNAALSQRLANHRSNFCTQAESDAGLCTLSSLPGGDTNAGLLFESAAPGSLQQQARQAYTQYVLGTPDQAIPASTGKSPLGQEYLLLKNNKDALMSIPAYSLSMIEAANTQSPDLGNKSPNDVLTLRVNQYFGGKEAQDWASVLTAQSERGLMVEAVKMGGLEAWIHHKQLQQNQRLELNLAALAMAAAQDAKANVDAKYERVLAETTKSAIK